MKRKGLRLFAMISGSCFAFCGAIAPAFAETTQEPKQPDSNRHTDKNPPEPSFVALRAGYGQYAMTAFNRAEESLGNDEIAGGACLAIELSPREYSIPVPLRKDDVDIPVRLPLGIEYLDANAKSTHALSGNSATVAWDLPVIGIYIAPEFDLFTDRKSDSAIASKPKSFRWRIRPVEIGYYWIGQLVDASLAISDRPGRLDLESRAVGFKTEVLGVYELTGGVNLLASVGYRWLRFTNVHQDPSGGFTISAGGPAAAPATLPTNLDYSGALATVGMRVQF